MGKRRKRGGLMVAAHVREAEDEGTQNSNAASSSQQICPHLPRGINVEQLSRIKPSFTHCHGCSAKKSKPKLKFTQPSCLAKRWVCLACGHIGCASVSNSGAEDMGTGHAWKHWLDTKHHLAVLCGHRLLCWCFHCKAAIPCSFIEPAQSDASTVEEERSGVLPYAVKLIWEKFVKEFSSEVAAIHRSPLFIDQCHGLSQPNRVVTGLINLGNTCFFNSVIQNLLALAPLRDYFSRESDIAEGTLTSALRKLYIETNCNEPEFISRRSEEVQATCFESGYKRAEKRGMSVISSSTMVSNTRSLFGAVCAKAPRFRGFQQQDSHELLRCLLDIIHIEEHNRQMTEAEPIGTNEETVAAKGLGGYPKFNSRTDSHQAARCIQQFFGGQLSSCISCCECGYSSVLHEPFNDLSLQIPALHPFKKHKKKTRQLASFSLSRMLQRGTNAKKLTEVDTLVENQQSPKQEVMEVELLPVASFDGLHIEDYGSGLKRDTAVENRVFNNDIVIENQKGSLVIKDSYMQEDEAQILRLTAEVLLFPDNTPQAPCLTSRQATGSYLERENSTSGTSSMELDEFDGFPQLFDEEEHNLFEREGEKTSEKFEDLRLELSGNAACQTHSIKNNQREPGFPRFSYMKEHKDQLLISLESCLSDFTKMELLVGENSWECGNCSKQQSRKSAGGQKAEQCFTQSKASQKEGNTKEKVRDCAGSFIPFDDDTSGSKCSSNEDKIVFIVNDTAVLLNQSGDCIEARSFAPLKESAVLDPPIEQVCLELRNLHKEGYSSSLSCFESQNWRTITDMEESDPRIKSCFSRSNKLGKEQHSSELLRKVPKDSGDLNCSSPVGGFTCLFEKRETKGAEKERQIGTWFQRGQDYSDDQIKTKQSSSSLLSGKEQHQSNCVDASNSLLGKSSNWTTTYQINSFSRNSSKLQNAEAKRTDDPEKTVKRTATKSLHISKAPSILTIHLKRFRQDTRGRLSKLSGHVAFQEELDLQPFMDPGCTEDKKSMYHLVGIVEHRGSMRGGHYIAYVRGPATSDEENKGFEGKDWKCTSTWHCISDTNVRKSSLQAVLKSEAYLLFYERCECK